MSHCYELPAGVELVDSAESKEPSPLYNALFSHGEAGIKGLDSQTLAGLRRWAMIHQRSLASDFSCGKAIRVTLGPRLGYEPADLSERMNAWVENQLARCGIFAERKRTRVEQIIDIMLFRVQIRAARRRNANNCVEALVAMDKTMREAYPESYRKRPSFWSRMLNRVLNYLQPCE